MKTIEEQAAELAKQYDLNDPEQRLKHGKELAKLIASTGQLKATYEIVDGKETLTIKTPD